MARILFLATVVDISTPVWGAAAPLLSLDLNKTTYLMGEPAAAMVRLTDPSRSGVTINEVSFDFGVGLYLFYKHQNESAYRRGDPVLPKENWGESRVPIPPGGLSASAWLVLNLAAGRTASGDIDRNPRLTYFTEEGIYQLKARFTDGNGLVLESNVIEVRVAEPIGGNLDAWKDWNNRSVLIGMWGGGSLELQADAITALADFVARHPGSLYADYARRRLQQGSVTEGKKDPSPEFFVGAAGALSPQEQRLSGTSDIAGPSKQSAIPASVVAKLPDKASDSFWLWGLGCLAAIAAIVFALQRRTKK